MTILETSSRHAGRPRTDRVARHTAGMGIVFDHINAWTRIPEGDPREAALIAAGQAMGIARQPVGRNEAADVEARMLELAATRDELGAHDFFVLATDAPRVEVLGWTVVHYLDSAEAEGGAVATVRQPTESTIGEPEVSTPSTSLGRATPVVLHTELPGRTRWSTKQRSTIVRWVQAAHLPDESLTAILTTVIPNSSDDGFVLPLVDQFALGMRGA